MSWYEHGETGIYYEESGTGVSVLLLPGWGGSLVELAPLRDALVPNFRVITADLPGSGKSTPQPRTYAPTYYENDARAFLAMLGAIVGSSVHLVGFSDGGEYALLMAALEPTSVRSLATWGSAGSLGDNPEVADPMASLIDDPIPEMSDFAEYMKATYGEDNARVMARSVAQSFRAIIEAGGDISRSRASDIACPALLITGEHDFLATPALVSDMARAIPRGEYLEVMGASHAVHHEQPEWLAETIAGWLARH